LAFIVIRISEKAILAMQSNRPLQIVITRGIKIPLSVKVKLIVDKKEIELILMK
jgi:hypothetical protein